MPALNGNSETRRPRLVVYAYAAGPNLGSEPGAGWGLIRTLNQYADCTVLVITKHIHAIREWQAQHPNAHSTFINVDDPKHAKFFKWHRIPKFLVYILWLQRARQIAERLHDEQPFDAAVHLTYSVYWLPTPATEMGIPSIWGPVGGAVTTPLPMWPLLGCKGIFEELLDLVSVRAMASLPWTRRTWSNATISILNNEETKARLPTAVQAKSKILNHTLFAEMPEPAQKTRRSYILFFSPLEKRKGPALVVRALAHTPEDVTLLFAADGPERKRLERLVQKLGVSHRVKFLGAISRDAALDLLSEAAAAVFTGLREEGGMALAEAMVSGTPVIVLANGGARTLAASATDPNRATLIQPGNIEETARRIGAAMTRAVQSPSSDYGSTLNQDYANDVIHRSLEEITSQSSASNLESTRAAQ